MDQESFRRLLQTPRPASASASPASTSTSTSKSKAKVIDASQPAFKPRKVKKTTEKQYRDRAAERRVGAGNDYADVEAVLEDFEKRNAGQDKSTLDAQRPYLGGDGAHSVLVKGLDMALVEQNRARAAALSTEDDESLERAFLEGTSASPSASPATEAQTQPPKKRTREELLRELKEKRAQTRTPEGQAQVKAKTAEEEARLLEQAKQAGKFRPIGFKPVGAASAGAEPGKVKKKKKVEGEAQGEGERKKKKRKVVEDGAKDGATPSTTVTTGTTTTETQPAPPPQPAPEPEPEALPMDFDIFADAGEYEGLQLDSETEGEAAEPSKPRPEGEETVQEQPEEEKAPPRRWIDTGSPELEPAPSSKPDLLSSVLGTTATTTTTTSKSASVPKEPEREPGEEDEGDEQPPARLVPLASSALPSIKDFLAMEEAASGGGKRRKRKGGGGGGEKKGASAEAKAERDYKRLKGYTEKKAAA
ncbi:putative ergosterol biosynthesis ERG4/ERG24 family protein [Lyophyllum shimeji]|uniref:Ergosterol biosynthesis ERG4/ERG24 family protein n=1 Tax=Lyophyllum shimeji TaxID=47721 RepID=A0A9P3URT5_LYOSH|nr:putative ergosterol biosynthesis ERG4/ERG24 family protein [Lyophyllum shimeji]